MKDKWLMADGALNPLWQVGDIYCQSLVQVLYPDIGMVFVRLTWRILSPGCSRLDAGPSGWTLVTKIPYKSEVT